MEILKAIVKKCGWFRVHLCQHIWPPTWVFLVEQTFAINKRTPMENYVRRRRTTNFGQRAEKRKWNSISKFCLTYEGLMRKQQFGLGEITWTTGEEWTIVYSPSPGRRSDSAWHSAMWFVWFLLKSRLFGRIGLGPITNQEAEDRWWFVVCGFFHLVWEKHAVWKYIVCSNSNVFQLMFLWLHWRRWSPHLQIKPKQSFRGKQAFRFPTSQINAVQ